MEENKSTKDQILDIALLLFAENSFHGASIRDIAKEIGKRESSIYNHFKSKEEIFEQIILKFAARNFGPIILTDKLIENISKPEKFFNMLGENLISFWNSKEERLFIKILLSMKSIKNPEKQYTLDNYLADFKKLTEFIFKEMISHNFIKKIDLSILSQEFISPLFLFQIELLQSLKTEKDQKLLLKKHVDFFWKAIKK